MDKEYTCLKCNRTYPAKRIVFRCDITNCKEYDCNHGVQCGLCILTNMPTGAKVNMNALMEIL